MALSEKSEYDLLRDSIQTLTSEVKELRVAQEQARNEFARAFVPRDILDLHLLNVRGQIASLEKANTDLKTYLKDQEGRAIGNTERLWLRFGTFLGAIATLIAILQYLTRGTS